MECFVIFWHFKVNTLLDLFCGQDTGCLRRLSPRPSEGEEIPSDLELVFVIYFKIYLQVSSSLFRVSV